MAITNILTLICFVHSSHLHTHLFSVLLIFISTQLLILKQVNQSILLNMCLNNCKNSVEQQIEYDPLEIDCFNPAYEDSCDYIERDETMHISVKENDLIVLQFNCCGLLSKQIDLSRFLYEIIGDLKIDLITLVETWLIKESMKG